jgi:hypothetical protein
LYILGLAWRKTKRPEHASIVSDRIGADANE